MTVMGEAEGHFLFLLLPGYMFLCYVILLTLIMIPFLLNFYKILLFLSKIDRKNGKND